LHAEGYAHDLATTLALERLDRDLFRGPNTIAAKARTTLYGGQVAAQALMAAGLTVPEERLPHSLHGYFLRPGRTERPVLLQVDRDRDGRSFSARHVTAVQDGEVIFSMLASFHNTDVESAFDDTPRIGVPSPDACRPSAIDPLLDIREVTHTQLTGERERFSDCLWMRAASPLPDDRLTHACALAYLSDHGSGFGQMPSEELGTGGPSIDHALWFQEPLAADRWVLLRMWPAKAVRTRGVYHGALRDADGRLGAALAQEQLLRRPRSFGNRRQSPAPGAEHGDRDPSAGAPERT
jgi:acyl-CoA thioesterase-2